jgi:predicted phosphodiesterase
MRQAILSDLHANYEALEAILRDLERRRVERIVCLGDVVGYYARPQACVDKIRELGCLCLQGNHDAAASGREEPFDFNDVAAQAVLWARGQLRPESRDWLAGLPTQLDIAEGVCAVHGSLRDRDEYLLSRVAVRENFQMMDRLGRLRAVFFGHTHRRVTFLAFADHLFVSQDDTLTMEPEARYLINPGGSGQPRDGVPGAPYAILDGDVVEFYRVEYDVEAAARAVAMLPFGETLAERLRRGV